MKRVILLAFLFSAFAPAQLVFDQHMQGGKYADCWVISATTAGNDCNGSRGPTQCQITIASYPSSGYRAIAINPEYTYTQPSSPGGGFAVVADFGQQGANWPPYGAQPTMANAPWSSTSVINFSGIWDVAVPGAIDGMTISAGDEYAGSFELDLDGNGNPVNVVVNFTLSEAP